MTRDDAIAEMREHAERIGGAARELQESAAFLNIAAKLAESGLRGPAFAKSVEAAYRAADDAERAASVAVDKLSRFTCEVSDVHD